MSAVENPPAFPGRHLWTSPGRPDFFHRQTGMTLRDHFAGQCAAAEVASAGANLEAAMALMAAAERAGQTIEQRIAFNAYNIADAMLAEREKRA